MDIGYIKLYRDMLNWEWMTDPNTAHLFVTILLMANWEDRQFKGLEVKRGQFVTSYETLSARTGLTVSKIRTALNNLESTHEVSRKIAGKWQVITVENYAKYQDSVQQLDTVLAGKSQANRRQIATTEEYKEYKELNNIHTCASKRNKSAAFDQFWELYPKKKGKEPARKAFAKLDLTEALLEEILTAVKAQKETRDWQKEGGQFIPYPATWLNQRRWEDEAEEQLSALERWAMSYDSKRD